MGRMLDRGTSYHAGTTDDFIGKPGSVYSMRSRTRRAEPEVESENCG